MPVSQSRFVPLEALPGGRRGGASFCVHRREGGRDSQGVRGVRNLRQGRDQTGEARSPISRSGKRVVALCRVVQIRRDERGGPVREDGKVRAARTQKTHAVRSGPVFPDAQGLVLAGRRWA